GEAPVPARAFAIFGGVVLAGGAAEAFAAARRRVRRGFAFGRFVLDFHRRRDPRLEVLRARSAQRTGVAERVQGDRRLVGFTVFERVVPGSGNPALVVQVDRVQTWPL